jgi:hypothetical protein
MSSSSSSLYLSESQLHRVLAPTLRLAKRRDCPSVLKRHTQCYLSKRRCLQQARRELRGYIKNAYGNFTELRRTSHRLARTLQRAQVAVGTSAAPLLVRAGLSPVVFVPTQL